MRSMPYRNPTKLHVDDLESIVALQADGGPAPLPMIRKHKKRFLSRPKGWRLSPLQRGRQPGGERERDREEGMEYRILNQA